ncbi:hypothetical protein H8S95_04140 [Pontibacter sp. KCTC 32443]|uniref:hypothetical protein n=1 Tax=Pontibacter TaxID=323449 RepID=UPI00164D4527|nr:MULTISPECIES: hypothetical protein [Pontibacter]MBC5773244.1 hypothetical protein [Pontibacter sp. KCTC 32443]
MEKKKYLCRWGDWDDRAINTYDTREKEVTEDYFTSANGYDPEDIDAVATLEVGEECDISTGNQIVTRIS